MNGLGFIHPGFLAAGIAAAVPLIIHLLFRQKARRVDIGSIYFLRVVLRDQAHRRKRTALAAPGGAAAWPACSCSRPSSPALTGGHSGARPKPAR